MFSSKMSNAFAITILCTATSTTPLSSPDLAAKLEVPQSSTLMELTAWAPVVGMVAGAAVSGYTYSKFSRDPYLAFFAVIGGGFVGAHAGEVAASASVKISNNNAAISKNQKESLALLLAHAKDNK